MIAFKSFDFELELEEKLKKSLSQKGKRLQVSKTKIQPETSD